MDAKQFLAEFGYIAHAQNGINKLRELVLSMAMQGFLVMPDKQDSNVERNLREIERIKKELINSGEISKQKFVPEIQKQEILYNIPPHWKWVRFGNIAQHNTGKTLDKRRNTGPKRDYITTSNLYWGRFDLNDLKQVPIEGKELRKCTATKGDLLICEGGEAGRAAVWDFDNDICFQNHIHRARFYGFIDPYYAFRYFEMLTATGEINEYRKGIGISSMSGKALASIPFALPPLEEQSRIVAKVDELMALCAQLEQQQQQKRTLQNQLRQATLQAVAAATSPFELKQHWQRLEANFQYLFSQPEDVADLRNLVLDLSVSGRIHKKSEDSSINLLEEISKTKRELIKEKQYKKSLKLEKVALEVDSEYLIPDNWIWCRLIDIGEINPRNTADDEESVAFVPMRCVSEKYLEPNSFEPKKWKEVKKGFTHFAKNDVVLAKITPCFENGKAAVISNTTTESKIGAGTTELHVWRPIHEDVLSEYVYAYLRSSMFRAQGIEKMTGTAGQKRVSAEYFASWQFPLPPLSEQQAIVGTIRKYMASCDLLEKKLKSTNTVAENLATAAVASLTGIQTPEEDEPLKAPQTELVAPVKLGPNKPDNKANAPLTALIARANAEIQAKDLWQRFGGEIDAFYAQLKTEIAHGWIGEPETAQMLEKDAEVLEA